MIRVTDKLWVNPSCVVTVAPAAEGGGSVLGLITGLSVAVPEPPHEVVARLCRTPSRLLKQPSSDRPRLTVFYEGPST